MDAESLDARRETPDPWVEVGRMVRDRRDELDLTQAELAERAGINLRTVGRIEKGRPTTRHTSSWSKLEVALGWPKKFIEDFLESRAIGAPIPVPGSTYVRVPVSLTAEIVTDIADEVAFAVTPNPSLDSLRAARRVMDEALRRAGLLPQAEDGEDSGESDLMSNTANG